MKLDMFTSAQPAHRSNRGISQAAVTQFYLSDLSWTFKGRADFYYTSYKCVLGNAMLSLITIMIGCEGFLLFVVFNIKFDVVHHNSGV